MADNDPGRDRLYMLLFTLGAIVLAYLGGAFSAVFNTFPYPQLVRPPFQALNAMWEKQAKTQGARVNTGLWHPARSKQTGVTRHQSDKSFDGYTLYTAAPRSGASLIDNDGEVVHEWDAPFREVWGDEAPHIDDPVPPDNIYWRHAELLPNGDVVATYAGTGDTPWGYGLVRVDKDSNVVWKYSANTHHDFHILPDGSVYALIQAFRDTDARPVPGVPQLGSPILEDFIVRLSPEGRELERLSMLDLFSDSRYREGLQMYPGNIDDELDVAWDPFHTNNVELVGEDFAEHHDFVEPEQLLISSRTTDIVAILDFDDARIVWASRGLWKQQHDPDPLPNGRLLLFDNRGHGGSEGPSRLVEYDLTTGAITWSFAGTPEDPFWSNAAASQQSLPNGNILVTSSLAGRLFEVTRGGEIVWEFQNPARRTSNGTEYVSLICSAARFSKDQLTFLAD